MSDVEIVSNEGGFLTEEPVTEDTTIIVEVVESEPEKPKLNFEFDDTFVFPETGEQFIPGDQAVLLDIIGQEGGYIFGSSDELTGDIVFALDSRANIHTFAGYDIVFVTNFKGSVATGSGGDVIIASGMDGEIRAGTGGDIIDATGFRGTIDLGADQDGDILLLSSDCTDVTIKNYDPTTDLVLWDGHDDFMV